jgi:hypothetical protein
MKAYGKLICLTEKENKSLRESLNIKEISIWVRNKAKAFTKNMAHLTIQANLKTIYFRAKAKWYKQTVSNITGTGYKVNLMVLGYINGLTTLHMKDTINLG